MIIRLDALDEAQPALVGVRRLNMLYNLSYDQLLPEIIPGISAACNGGSSWSHVVIDSTVKESCMLIRKTWIVSCGILPPNPHVYCSACSNLLFLGTAGGGWARGERGAAPVVRQHPELRQRPHGLVEHLHRGRRRQGAAHLLASHVPTALSVPEMSWC